MTFQSHDNLAPQPDDPSDTLTALWNAARIARNEAKVCTADLCVCRVHAIDARLRYFSAARAATTSEWTGAVPYSDRAGVFGVRERTDAVGDS